MGLKISLVVVEGQGGICPRRRPHSGPIELYLAGAHGL